MPPKKILVVGADGQLGKALREAVRRRCVRRVRRPRRVRPRQRGRLRRTGTGRTTPPSSTPPPTRPSTPPRPPKAAAAAWAVNVTAVARLARTAVEHDLTLVHVSSDYVFDGSREVHARRTEPSHPLGVYGQTKAAGDAVVSVVPRHYIVRTSWVIGEGNNFVRTMAVAGGSAD